MEIKRAAEILDPERGERFFGEAGLEEVKEACRLAVKVMMEKANAEIVEKENDLQISQAQKEMKLYEDFAETFGKDQSEMFAVASMEQLQGAILEDLNSGISVELEKEEKIIRKIQNARANTEIALNVLAVIFEDCSERELEKMERIRQTIEK